jgi:hypothetical protein
MELIQTGCITLLSKLHGLINSIWNKKELPQEWKKSITVNIYNKSDKTDCRNYTGISLITKCIQNFISSLAPYIEIIGDCQFGYCHSRATADQMFCICQILEKKWKYSGTVHQLFMDFMKVCDSVG